VHDRSQIEQRAAGIRKQRLLLDTWVNSAENDVSAKVKAVYAEIESLKPHFAWFWAGHTFIAALVFEQMFSVKSEVGLWIASSIAGAVSAFFHQDHVHSKRKSETSLQSRLNELELERQAISQYSLLQSQRIEQGNPFEAPEAAAASPPNPTLEIANESEPIAPQAPSPRGSANLSLSARIAEAESRVIRPIPTIPVKHFACHGCGRTINLNANVVCNELRCPAKLLTDA
jgi:hypothetical protein